MDRRRFVGIAGLSLFAASLAAEAQQAAKGHKVGLLAPPPGAYVAAFEESLRQLGYVRGSNIALETASATTAALLPRLLQICCALTSR